MTLATLSDVLQPALRGGYAVGGLVTLGWEDMRAYTEAAQALGAPLILQAGPSCREHTPLPVLGHMFRHLAASVDVPVVAHLDHGYTQNIDETAAIAEMARDAGISCEGEIGFVGYANGDNSTGTDPDEAARFARDSGVDAMAISCGNVHLQEDKQGGLDVARIKAIEAVTDLPLVIHGGSGVPVAQRMQLAAESRICKFNIGTELRMAFGQALRAAVTADATRFDRVQILRETADPVKAAAMRVLTAFGAPDLRT